MHNNSNSKFNIQRAEHALAQALVALDTNKPEEVTRTLRHYIKALERTNLTSDVRKESKRGKY